jgi:hypothetical protein
MRSSLWLTSVSLVLVSTVALAQTQSQPRETMPEKQDSHSDGTAPHGMGSTGWTGGTGGSHIGTSNELSTPGPQTTSSGTVGLGNTPSADTPLGLETATGLDLQGPPTRFPTDETPE